jgi:hypothetical protein
MCVCAGLGCGCDPPPCLAVAAGGVGAPKSGVPHLGGHESWAFEADRHTPSSILCQVWTAWSKLLEAAAAIRTAEPFRYDL